MKAHRPFFQTVFFVIFGRLGGFLFPFAAAFFYGAGASTDAFFLAYGLIFFLTRILTHIFESVIVPYLAERKTVPETMFQFIHGVFRSILPWVVAASVLIAFFLGSVLIRFSGWEKGEAYLAVRLYGELIPFLFLALGTAAANGLFFANKIFWFPAISPLLRWAVFFTVIFTTHSFLGIHALTLGLVAGEALRAGLAMILLHKKVGVSGRLWERGEGVRGSVRNFFKHIAIQIFGLMATCAIYFVDLYSASGLAEGSVSLMNYADRLLQVPYLLFQEGFLQIFYSFWSEDYYQRSSALFWQQSRRDVRRAFWAAIIVAVLVAGFGRPLILLVFSQRDFSPAQLDTLGILLTWLAFSLPSAVAGALYTRMLFVMKHSQVYCAVGWSHLGLKIFLNVLMVHRFGIVGIAISTVAVNALEAVFLSLYLKNQRKNLPSGSRWEGM